MTPSTPPEPDLRVLVVDDDEAFRHLLSTYARAHGGLRIVGEATDGADAVRLARSLQPDVILLDVSMPHMTGDEALPHVRNVAPGSAIVMFTAYPAPSPVDWRAAGADAVVSKALPLDGLLVKVQALVGAHPAEAARARPEA